jgi:lysyl-tRNA synthetase class 2
MSHRAARCLRPYLFHSFKRSQCVAHTRAFTSPTIVSSIKAPKDITNDYERRLAQLDAYKPRDDWYPRIATHAQVERTPVDVFQHEYAQLVNDETRDDTRVIIGTQSLPT